MKITIEEVYINIPKHCRKLMKTEDYPKELEIYRGEMLCLTVDVEKAAELLLVENEEDSPHYRKYYPSEIKALEKLLGRQRG